MAAQRFRSRPLSVVNLTNHLLGSPAGRFVRSRAALIIMKVLVSKYGSSIEAEACVSDERPPLQASGYLPPYLYESTSQRIIVQSSLVQMPYTLLMTM